MEHFGVKIPAVITMQDELNSVLELGAKGVISSLELRANLSFCAEAAVFCIHTAAQSAEWHIAPGRARGAVCAICGT